MDYKFTPIKFSEENPGVVKINESTGNYSTHIAPYDFEIDESDNMFICGKEYYVSEDVAIKLYDSGYLAYLDESILDKIIIED
jgi:hypothetical protein